MSQPQDFAGGTAGSGVKACLRLRVAFVNTHPIQYFAPLYAYLGEHCGVDVTALYLSDFSLRGARDKGFGQDIKWDIDLLAGYESKFIGRANEREVGGFFSLPGVGLLSAIRQGQYDGVVVHGHNFAAHYVALAACKISGTPVFARSETHLGLKRTVWKEAVRTPLIKTLYKAFDGFLAIGSANARYYIDMGVSGEKIFPVPYTVDNLRFMTSSKISDSERIGVRARLGVSNDAPIILYSAKFDCRKRPDDLLTAFAYLQGKGVEGNLVLVGSGSMEPELRKIVERGGIANVSFPGFVNQCDLPRVYAACEIFVLPSDNEPWGLAVNEAMCAGLPVVLSEEIGCAEDLVTPGINGALFPAGNISALADALLPLLMDAALRGRLGAASRKRMTSWSYAECGAGLRSAVIATIARKQGEAKHVDPRK